MDQLVKLVVGDWSNDGHGRIKEVIFRTNVNTLTLDKAFKNGCAIIGIDWKNECAEYEEHNFSEVGYKNLVNAFTKESLDKLMYERSIDSEEFAVLFMWIAQRGNSYIMFEKLVDIPSLEIGGYGLFYC